MLSSLRNKTKQRQIQTTKVSIINLSFFLPPSSLALIVPSSLFHPTLISEINFFPNPSVFFCTIPFVFKLSLTKSMTSFLFKDSYNKFSSSLIELSAWPYSSINSSNTNITECMHHLFSLRCFIRAFNTFY